jgi:hypothetical protein
MFGQDQEARANTLAFGSHASGPDLEALPQLCVAADVHMKVRRFKPTRAHGSGSEGAATRRNTGEGWAPSPLLSRPAERDDNHVGGAAVPFENAPLTRRLELVRHRLWTVPPSAATPPVQRFDHSFCHMEIMSVGICQHNIRDTGGNVVGCDWSGAGRD